MELYRISTGHTSGWIKVSKGTVVETAPVFAHLFGRLLVNVEHWAETNKFKFEKIEAEVE